MITTGFYSEELDNLEYLMTTAVAGSWALAALHVLLLPVHLHIINEAMADNLKLGAQEVL